MFLNCKTWFSFHYGTYKPEDLISDAQELGIDTLGLTNINSTVDCWDFVHKCQRAFIKPIIGTEVRNGDEFCYVLLAKNNEGLFEINKFLSYHLQNDILFPETPCLSIEGVWIIYRLDTKHFNSKLKENELIGLSVQDLTSLSWQSLNDFSQFVVLQAVTYQNKTYYNLHRILRAIAKNTLLSKLRKSEIAAEGEILFAPQVLLNAFQQYPQILQSTLNLIDSCSIEMDFGKDKTIKTFLSNEQQDVELLKDLAFQGCIKRYGKENKEALNRVERELKVITELNFSIYFLITWDILTFAQKKGFYHVGRGSGANSIVAYCLGITDVDPIKLDLYFERFLNPNRASPPDFDIDFSWQDRNTIYDYIFEKYGCQYVALLGSYTTFQRKVIVRELGKVFGLPKQEIDKLSSIRQWDPEDKIQFWIKKYGDLLLNFPNNISIHAGGVLISQEPINKYAVTHFPPKGYLTVQMDMFEAERIGLNKLDILSQRGLGHIKDALKLIAENQNIQIDIHNIDSFINDPKLANQIKYGNTIGCFYIESPAMRQLLQKLQCTDYKTLVAASSIIRPGVAQSGMMKQFIERFHDKNKIVYLHPKMEELLQETNGVMVYQEDVIKVAHHFGGIPLDQADILRKAMSGKYRSENKFEELKNSFFQNCRVYGYDESVIREVWRQMESFGGYSFAKGHSASFAVESYQSLFFKTYFPKEFYVSVINNFGGFYRTEFYFHELRRLGGEIELPCVNKSDYLTNISGNKVYVGLIHIQGLEEKFAKNIISERINNGLYKDLNDFINRLEITNEQLNLLIRIGALRFTGLDKKTLYWQGSFNNKHVEKHQVPTLFGATNVDFKLPEFQSDYLEDLKDELEILGFLIGDYFSLLDDEYLTVGIQTRDLAKYKNEKIKIIGRLVTLKETRTIKGERMCFGTFLDSNGGWLDTVHFPEIYKESPFYGAGFYEITGYVMEEFGVYSVQVIKMIKLGFKFGSSH